MQNKTRPGSGKLSYLELQELYDETNSYLIDLMKDHKRMEEALNYYSEFVRYKNQEEEFRYFRENAHEVLTLQ